MPLELLTRHVYLAAGAIESLQRGIDGKILGMRILGSTIDVS